MAAPTVRSAVVAALVLAAAIVLGGDVRTPGGRVRVEPQAFVAEATLFGHLASLTSIRPYAGWRNAGSAGEAEALDWVAAELAARPPHAARGLTVERTPFTTFTSTEFRTARVVLTVGGRATEVPAFAISGHRDLLARVLAFDSDGVLNDTDPDLVTVAAAPEVIGRDDHLSSLPSLAGRVALLDYAVVDRSVLGTAVAAANADEVLARHPAAIVCVTTFSNRIGESHGTFAGDLPIWTGFDPPLPPILNVRLEDLAGAGITRWADLARVARVELSWDADVVSPGRSSYLAARVPGVDGSRAVILGAHLDSPNTPGAIDDGSGAVTLLQVAVALDAARRQPPVDLWLVWFGSHERGLYGSSAFVADQQELLDRTLAMLQVDCLSVPVEGVSMYLNLEAWSYGRFGNGHLPWPDFLADRAAELAISVRPLSYYGVVSDSTDFTAWDVPNANLIFMDPHSSVEVHFAGHMHDPYDTVELARSEADTLVAMARVAVAAALDTGRLRPDLRVTPTPDRRALFVASHTESLHMTPTHLVDFSQTLAWHGFDVDMVPYGTPLTAAELAASDLVVALPPHAYLGGEAYTAAELDALETWTRAGGTLVVAASAHRLKYRNLVYEANPDAAAVNLVAARFGAAYGDAALAGITATPVGSHPLVASVTRLALATDNGLPITSASAQPLARLSGHTVAAVVAADAGQVLLLGDLGLLGNDTNSPENLRFWSNLAEWARAR